MARSSQRLINYHTGSKTTNPSVSDVEYGEIVVRHNIEEPQILIKADSAGTDVFVPFIASAQVSTAIEAVSETLDGNIADVEARIDAVSATVKETYWTSAETKTYVDNYADAVSAAAKSSIDSVIGTSEDASSVDSVKGAKKYTDEKVTALSGNLMSYIDEQGEDVSDAIAGLSGKVVEVSGAVITLSGDVLSYVDTKLSVVYKYKGSEDSWDAITGHSATAEVGDVYNLTVAHGDYPAGTNWAWTGSEWDALGGSIDTSDFATKSGDIAAINSHFEEVEEDVAIADGKAVTVSGNLITLSAAVESTYATKTYADNAKIDAEIASSAYTDSQVVAVSGALVTYVDETMEDVSEDIAALNASASTWNTAAGNALYTGALGTATNDNQTTQSGAKMSYTAGEGFVLDLSELRIDCGDF